jgi:hypothetical protein
MMPRPLGSKNGVHKPRPSDPQAQLQKIIADESVPLEARQSALQALEACKPALTPQPNDDPFAGCEWPPAGHAGCIYDSHGNYPDCDAHGEVQCRIDASRRHYLPFGKARAKFEGIDLDELDRLEKELLG